MIHPWAPDWSGSSATTWSARSNGSPTHRTDDQGYPDAVIDVVGDIAAYDHWRQRVLLASVALCPKTPPQLRSMPPTTMP